jgi:hypothetical protein
MCRPGVSRYNKGDSNESSIKQDIPTAQHRLPILRIGRARHFGPRLCPLQILWIGSTLETLRDIIGLPDTLGAHACECGHPEMRELPGGVFHCPACGSEVLPTEASSGVETLGLDWIEP